MGSKQQPQLLVKPGAHLDAGLRGSRGDRGGVVARQQRDADAQRAQPPHDVRRVRPQRVPARRTAGIQNTLNPTNLRTAEHAWRAGARGLVR